MSMFIDEKEYKVELERQERILHIKLKELNNEVKNPDEFYFRLQQLYYGVKSGRVRE